MSIKKRIFISLFGTIALLAVVAGVLFVFVKKSDSSLTDADLEQLDYVNETLDSLRDDEDFIKMEPEQQLDAMFDAINALADEGKINAESILCNRDELYISYEYECGVLGSESFGGEPGLCGGSGDHYIEHSFEDTQDEDIMSSAHNGRAIILDAMLDRESGYDAMKATACINMAGIWTKGGVDTKIDYTVTLDDLLTLEGYDYIVFYMHGNYYNYKFQGNVPMMKLAQRVSEEVSQRYRDDLDARRIGTSGGYYTVTPQFFAEHYGRGGSNLNGSFLFLASCQQMGINNDNCEQWADILPVVGASALIAFHNNSNLCYATDLANVYMQYLLQGETAQKAFEESITLFGANEREYLERCDQSFDENREPGIPLFRGDTNARLNFVVNSDVEIIETLPLETEEITENDEGAGSESETISPTPTPMPSLTPTPEPETVSPTAVTVDDQGHVILGHYEQDGDLTNGPEPIVWEIVNEEDGSLLLISRDILDSQPFNEEWTEVTWENCSLRQWLNNDFFNEAFDEAEQALIETTVCEPDSIFGGERGNATEDKVFCLSVEEIFEYYEMDNLYEYDMNGYCIWLLRNVTQYAIDQGVWHHIITEEEYYDDQYALYSKYEPDVIGMDAGMWWLRTPGNFDDNACRVTTFGAAGYYEYTSVDDSSVGVRPVIRINVGESASTEITGRYDIIGLWLSSDPNGEENIMLKFYEDGSANAINTDEGISISGTWNIDGDTISIEWEDGSSYQSVYTVDGDELFLEQEGDTVFTRLM